MKKALACCALSAGLWAAAAGARPTDDFSAVAPWPPPMAATAPQPQPQPPPLAEALPVASPPPSPSQDFYPLFLMAIAGAASAFVVGGGFGWALARMRSPARSPQRESKPMPLDAAKAPPAPSFAPPPAPKPPARPAFLTAREPPPPPVIQGPPATLEEALARAMTSADRRGRVLARARRGEGLNPLLGSLRAALRHIAAGRARLEDTPEEEKLFHDFSRFITLEALEGKLKELADHLADLTPDDEEAGSRAIEAFFAEAAWFGLRRAELLATAYAPASAGWMELRLGLTLAAAALRGAACEGFGRFMHYGRLLTKPDPREGRQSGQDSFGVMKREFARGVLDVSGMDGKAIDYGRFFEERLDESGLKTERTAHVIFFNMAEWSKDS